MTIRDYNPDTDLAAVKRIWRECGWIKENQEADVLETFLSVGEGVVATVDGEAEGFAHSTPGLVQYQNEELKLGAVTAVTTSHIARKLGFASKLTAKVLARQAESGHEVSALGMFDQGFYDRLGFGTGTYETWITFDPTSLVVDYPFRPPKRLKVSDYKAVHGAMMARAANHGNVRLLPPEIVAAELAWDENTYGLGYFDGPNGTLSHFIWGSAEGEHGPYTVTWRAWQTREQLLELLALIKSLGDQVGSFGMLEFGEIQLQDLLREPMRQRRTTAKAKHENKSVAIAYWQMRILDLEACLAKTHLPASPLKFNLRLSDPVEAHLDEGHNWRGIGGDYIVQLGEDSGVETGRSRHLPTLNASVNAFSRLWFGIRPASSLAITDDLEGGPELIKALDRTVRLPKAHLGWDF